MNKLPEPNFFYVNRGLLFSDRWLSESFTRGQAWVDLFGLAQHKKGYMRIRGIRINLERGQLAYSQLTLAKRWKWSRNKVRRYLKELENAGDIEQQNNEVTTVITIIKYNIWQGIETPNDTTEGQQKDNRRYTYKNDKNVKNDKNNTGKLLKSNSADINKIISIFATENKTLGYGNMTQRRACDSLIQKFGLEAVSKLAEIAVKAQEQEFAPVITSPLQLMKRYGDLKAWHKRYNNQSYR